MTKRLLLIVMLLWPTYAWGISKHIAWYRGGSTLTNSGSTYQATNIETAFDELTSEEGYTWEEIDTAQDVVNGALMDGGEPKYAVVYFMGGSGSAYNSGLGEDGKAAVQAFVNAGGGYIGTCAGAFYGSDNYSDLWPGDANYVAVILDVDYVLNTGLAVNAGFASPLENVQYYNGCWLESGVANTDYVATYDSSNGSLNGNPSVIFSYYGEGPVLLSGGHPEEGLGTGDLEYFKQLFKYIIELGAYEDDAGIPTLSGCSITGGAIQ